MNSLTSDLKALVRALIWYSHKKIIKLSHQFEGLKNFIKEVLMVGRGMHRKRFFHGSILTLALVAILTSGVFGGQSLISASYPGIGEPDPRFAQAFEPFPNGPIIQTSQDPRTSISQKPRSETVEYKAESGDTIFGVAQKFGVSTDTIKWANDLTDLNQLKPGQTLKILPVTGVSHIVKSGDTLESVAKKYSAEQQAILDFPFNDVPDDFKLKVGQLLTVPDGSPPEIKAPKLKPQYFAQGPSSAAFQAPFGASFVWPASGQMTQYFSWYHPGVDIANRAGPGVAACDGGTVLVAGWPDNTGYGNRVVIDHGNGYRSLYAHLSNIYVSSGDTISRGQLLGQMGSTGRSTGTHLHLEIHYKGVAMNPLAILK